MKFCTKCGTELLDEAVICTKCGCMVEGAKAPVVKAPRKRADGLLDVTEKKPSTLLVVFNFVCSVLAVLAVAFLFVTVYKGYVETFESVDLTHRGLYLSDVEVETWAYLWYDYDFAITALIFSIASLVFGIASFVLTLVEKHRDERLFSGIFKLFAGIVMVTVAAYFSA